jgi:hypothetical protein
MRSKKKFEIPELSDDVSSDDLWFGIGTYGMSQTQIKKMQKKTGEVLRIWRETGKLPVFQEKQKKKGRKKSA